MGVTPVRALNAIKPDFIGGVANNPIQFWILRYHLANSILSKFRTFLARKLLIKVLYKKFLFIRYRIIIFNEE